MKLYVQLGKVGDILNLLPLLRMENPKPGLMVAREFAGILDGVSYVEPFIFDGSYHEVAKACEKARTISEDWVCTQVNCSTEQVSEYVYGPAKQKSAVTSSFQKESWKVAGALDKWDAQGQLLFDQRDLRRETKLQIEFLPTKFKGRIVLLSTGGASSPFPYAQILTELVRAKCQDLKKWKLIDLADVKAERFYDVLALYDAAHCLIATDSAPLHLARANVGLPVFAFTNDKALLWHGSPWRPNHVFYCRYSDFPQRVNQFVWTFDNLGKECVGPERPATQPAIAHVWCEYDGPHRWPDWVSEYRKGHWLMTPIELGACGRDSVNTLKDPKRYPYLKDCVRMGMQRVRDEDYVCLTRPTTRCHPNMTEVLLKAPATFAYRIRYEKGQQRYWPIGELFCARKDWWAKRLKEIPDLIFGKDHFWSHMLAALFNRYGAQDATGMVYDIK